MRKFLGLVLSLTTISGVCAFVLATVDAATREPIAQMMEQKKVAAAKAVLPPETVSVAEEKDARGEPLYVGKDASGAVVGYALTGADAGGYGGEIVLMVGFRADKSTVVCYRTLSAAETPGLGSKMNDPAFSAQFAGKKAAGLSVVKDGGEIEAITAATITSRAVCKAIAAAAEKLR
jgi:electron transport complex protein RnfG